MITRRSVLVLATVTAVVTAAAIGAQYARWSETIRSVASEPAFPGIGADLSKVTRIQIIRSEDNPAGSFTFSRSGDRWTIDDKGGYPATESVIRGMLLGFTELELVEAKTRDPNRHAKLHLADTARPGSKASRVVLSDADGKPLLDALFGKRVPSISGGKPSIYLRRQDDNQTWLATGELEIRAGAVEWLPNDLVSILRERVDRTIHMAPGQEPLELFYDKDFQRFEIVDLPETLKVSSRYRLLQVAILQERLGFVDVRPAEGLEVDPKLGGAIWRTKDGLTVNLGLAREGNDKERVWAIFSVDVASDADEKVVKEGAEIAERTKGWAYWLGDDALQRLWARQVDLTEPK